MRYEGYNIILHLWHRLLVGGKCNKNDSRTFMTKLTRSSNVLLFYLSFSLSLSQLLSFIATLIQWYSLSVIQRNRWTPVNFGEFDLQADFRRKCRKRIPYVVRFYDG